MGVVVIEITFDSVPLFSADGSMTFRFTKGAPGEPPTMRGEDDRVSARAGRSSYPRLPDILPIGLEGQVQAEIDSTAPLADAEFRRRSLLSLFRTTTPKVLSAVLPDGAVATISARVEPPVLVKEVVAGLYFEFDVALESIDPTWVITPVGS